MAEKPDEPDRDSRVWASKGLQPAQGEEPVEGSSEYPASWMNWALWSKTKDIKDLFDWVGGVVSWIEAETSAITNALSSHIDDTDNPHSTTVNDIGAATDPHGNESHDPDFAEASELTGKADDPHDNNAHAEDYLTDADIENQRLKQDEITIEVRSSEPTDPEPGRLWVRDDL